MTLRSVVAAMPRAALLVDRDLRAVARSASWAQRYADHARPFRASPLAEWAAAAQKVLADGLEPDARAIPFEFDVQVVEGDAPGERAGLLITRVAEPNLPRVASALRTVRDHLEIVRGSVLSPIQQVQLSHLSAEVDALRQALGIRGAAEPEPVVSDETSILVVDDNSTNVKLLVHMCNVAGLAADTARDGAEALDKMERKRYDLVFLDVMMPGASGIEVTEVIRRRYGARPCVVGVTAMPSTEGEGLVAGMDRVFIKPMRVDMVMEAIQLVETRA